MPGSPEAREHTTGRGLAELGCGLGDHCQRWVDERRPLEVVEADQRDVHRHLQAEVADCPHRAERHEVVGGEQRGRALRCLEHTARRAVFSPVIRS